MVTEKYAGFRGNSIKGITGLRGGNGKKLQNFYQIYLFLLAKLQITYFSVPWRQHSDPSPIKRRNDQIIRLILPSKWSCDVIHKSAKTKWPYINRDLFTNANDSTQ